MKLKNHWPYLLFWTLLLCSAHAASGQGYFWQSPQKKKHLSYLSVDAGPGLRMYFGDIQQKGSLFNPMKIAYGLGVRYQATPRWGFALHGAGRGYKGKAEHGGFPDAIDEMEGKLWEGSAMVQFSWLRWEDFTKRNFTDRDPVTKANAFIGVGIGASMFSGSFTSRRYNVSMTKDSLGRDSAVYTPIDNSGSGSGVGIHIPLTFGVRYRFNPHWSLSAESQYHLYISDNLDGLQRGANDGMGVILIKLGYTFGQDKKKANLGKTPKQLKKGR